MNVLVSTESLDPLNEIAEFEAQHLKSGEVGAAVHFVGTMRDFNEGDPVSEMELEYYPGMTERVLEELVSQAKDEWPILECMIRHRAGSLQPGDPIVLVAVWSAHRGAAFDACRFLIEELKHRAPFWKRELTDKGSRWVAENTKG